MSSALLMRPEAVASKAGSASAVISTAPMAAKLKASEMISVKKRARPRTWKREKKSSTRV